MSMELINLSSETKAYLNNLRHAIEKQAEAAEKLARAQKPKFVELPIKHGVLMVNVSDAVVRRWDVSENETRVYVKASGEEYEVRLPYEEVCKLFGVSGAVGGSV